MNLNTETKSRSLSFIDLLPGQPTTTATFDLDTSDRRTLKAVLRIFKAARKETKSNDPNVAKTGFGRLTTVIGYMAGFLDGKRRMGLNPAFGSIYQASQKETNFEALLDEFQNNLEELVNESPTREILLIILGAELVAIGILLKEIDRRT